MRQILLCSLFVFVSFGLVVNDAAAKRFGVGGRGFGMMRSNSVFSHSPRASRPAPAAALKQNRWRGALTGLLLGSALTSLFMGHGFGGALLSWLFAGIGIYLIINFLRRRES